MKTIVKLDSEIVLFKAQDSNNNIVTNPCFISTADNVCLSQTANLPAKLKLCVGARVMLTDNISVSDRLINGSIGTVTHLHRQRNFNPGTVTLRILLMLS